MNILSYMHAMHVCMFQWVHTFALTIVHAFMAEVALSPVWQVTSHKTLPA